MKALALIGLLMTPAKAPIPNASTAPKLVGHCSNMSCEARCYCIYGGGVAGDRCAANC